jgi:hypothetical protein
MIPRDLPLLFLLLTGCFDTPVKRSDDWEKRGVVIEQPIRYRYAERYSVGFAFRPTFVKGDFWHVRDFTAQEARAWSELSPTVAIEIWDSSKQLRLSDESKFSRDSGWDMTNGSQDGTFPAAVWKPVSFSSRAGRAMPASCSAVYRFLYRG